MEIDYFLYPFRLNSTLDYYKLNKTIEYYRFSNDIKKFDIIIPEAFFKGSLCRIEVPICMVFNVANTLKVLYKKYKEGKIVNLKGDICLTVPFIINLDADTQCGRKARRSIKTCVSYLTEKNLGDNIPLLKNTLLNDKKEKTYFYETYGCLTDINSNVLLIYTVNLYNKDIYKSQRSEEVDAKEDLDLNFSCADPAIRFNKDILNEDTFLNKEVMRLYRYMLKNINERLSVVKTNKSYIDTSNLSLTMEDLSRYNRVYEPVLNFDNTVDDEKHIKNLINNYLDMFEKENNINFAYV